MLILSNVLALALIVADEPRPAPPPIVVQGHLTGTITGVGSSDAPASGTPVGASNLPTTMPKITKPHTSGNEEADEIWNLTLPDAIKIGLDNSEVVRVISMGAQGIPLSNFDPNPPEDVKPPADSSVLIARLNADASVWNFKAAIMAHVRSIEQQYWELSHQQVVLWSRETAVRLAEEILRRERAGLKVGKAAPADVAETELQLENYQLNLVTATSDVITTERQLRNILGLPPADHRRIVPSTAPTEARLEPDWEISVRQMTESQPDIAQQRALVRLTELQLLLARNQLLPPLGLDLLHDLGNLGHTLEGSDFWGAALAQARGTDPARFRDPEFIEHQVGLVAPGPMSCFRAPLANTRQAQYHLLRERATLQQITHQTTHSLARFFLEIDANYKQFRTARRLRTASQQQLEAQRAFYEEGRITIDRLLDAITHYTNAIAQESQYKASYNTSIAAFEEAKGTLLAYDNITVVEGPSPRKKYIQAKDKQVATASLELPPLPPPPPEPAPIANPQPAPMMYKLKARLGGVKFLEIEVEVSPGSTSSP